MSVKEFSKRTEGKLVRNEAACDRLRLSFACVVSTEGDFISIHSLFFLVVLRRFSWEFFFLFGSILRGIVARVKRLLVD